MADTRIQEYFPESYIALQKEISNHPKLVEFLQNHPVSEFEVRIAEIATYCDVLLDDWYTPADLDKLADILVRRLQEKRMQRILPFSVN